MLSVSREHLESEVVDAIIRTAQLIGKKKTKPDREWMIFMLNQFQPDHPFFDVGYQRPGTGTEKIVRREVFVNNEKGLFDGLPVQPYSSKRKGRIDFRNPAEKQKAKLEQMEA